MAISQINDLQWPMHIGTLRSDGANSIVVDALGNIYVAGYTEGRLNVDRPIGMFINNDSFVAKYSSDGELIWLHQFGNPNLQDGANALCLDPFGNVYVAGYTYDALAPVGKGGMSDGYVMKFSNDGIPLWTQEQHFGSDRADKVYGIATDSLGFVYITGEKSGGFAGGLSSPDIFLTKLDGNGQENWTQTLGTSGFDTAQDIAIDQDGNIFIVGSTSGSLASESRGFSDIFIAKYSPDGTLLWLDQQGSSSSDNAYGVAVDQNGSAFVVGSTQGGGTSFSKDAFIIQYDSDGALVGGWSFGVDFRNDIAYSIAVEDDLLYVTGSTGGSLANDSAGADDVFLLVMNQLGEVIDFDQFGSSGYDVAKDIALSPSGDVYLTGYTSGVLGEPYFGYNDAFVAKFSNVVEPIVIPEPLGF